jgi:hypothetical protein
MTQYNRYAVLPLDEVVEKVFHHWKKKKVRIVVSSGHTVGVSSLRLKSFAEATKSKKGLHCKACGVKASFFAVENFKGVEESSMHLNLYGTKDGADVLFTRDHVKARAKGGNDTLGNSQVLCSPCNGKKGVLGDRTFKSALKKEKQACQSQN